MGGTLDCRLWRMPTDYETFQSHVRDERRQDRLAAVAFVQACRDGDAEAMLYAVDQINETVSGWTVGIRKLARELTNVSDDIRRAFLQVWIETKMLPLTVGDHRALCTAARVLLPPYRGAGARLFRGANTDERRRRNLRCVMDQRHRDRRTFRARASMVRWWQRATGNRGTASSDHLCRVGGGRRSLR